VDFIGHQLREVVRVFALTLMPGWPGTLIRDKDCNQGAEVKDARKAGDARRLRWSMVVAMLTPP
jgi:hypothetical protein